MPRLPGARHAAWPAKDVPYGVELPCSIIRHSTIVQCSTQPARLVKRLYCLCQQHLSTKLILLQHFSSTSQRSSTLNTVPRPRSAGCPFEFAAMSHNSSVTAPARTGVFGTPGNHTLSNHRRHNRSQHTNARRHRPSAGRSYVKHIKGSKNWFCRNVEFPALSPVTGRQRADQRPC